MWNGSVDSVPSGWALCDGANGTPDLRGRFIVGAGSSGSQYTVGSTGGVDSVILDINQMPTHNHVVSDTGHIHPLSITLESGNSGAFPPPGAQWGGNSDFGNKTYNGDTAISYANITCGDAGGNQAHENRPPYFALCYIMKI